MDDLNPDLVDNVRSFLENNGRKYDDEKVCRVTRKLYARLLYMVEQLGYHKIQSGDRIRMGLLRLLEVRVPSLSQEAALSVAQDIFKDLYLGEEP